MQSFKRKIFYLAGYDPRGARHYHGLLGQQVAEHNAGGGAPEGLLAMSGRRKVADNIAWDMADGAAACQGEHEFLVWDDLVRARWAKWPPALLWQGTGAYWHLCRHLDWRLARAWPRGTWVTLFSPGLLFLGLPLLLALGLWLGLRWELPDWAAAPLALGLGWGGALVLQKRLHSLWLLRFVIFYTMFARWIPARGKGDDALAARLDAFADTIDAALAEEWDEVLFVSHSAGTMLAVVVMARLLARRDGVMPERFAMVTLGSVIPLLACRRDAPWFGGMLDALAAGDFRWLDVASKTDGACVPLVAPCLGRAAERPRGLVQLSPRWFRYCDPGKYEARRRDKHLTHFDYLRRLDRPSPLDYIGLVAAPRGLAQSIAAFEREQAAEMESGDEHDG